MTLKQETIRSNKLRAAARAGNPCVRCGKQDGTVCGRHYNGQRQHMFGKGGRQKVDDFLIAEMCNDCDAEFTEGTGVSARMDRIMFLFGGFDLPDHIVMELRNLASDVYSEEMLTQCMATLIRRREEGVLKV